jgi:hypothetical protein
MLARSKLKPSTWYSATQWEWPQADRQTDHPHHTTHEMSLLYELEAVIVAD